MTNKEIDRLNEPLFRFGCCCIVFIGIAFVIAGFGIVEYLKN